MSSLVLAVTILAQAAAADLAVALQALAAGEQPVVTRPVAAEAIKALETSRDLTAEGLDQHLRLIARYDARAVPRVLGRLVARDGAALEHALRAADRLGPGDRPALLRALEPAAAARPALVALCHGEDEAAARGALGIVIPLAPPKVTRGVLVGLLEAERAPRAKHALELLALTPASSELLLVLEQAEPLVTPELRPAFAAVLMAFVDQQPALAADLLAAVRRRPAPAFLEAFAAMPPARWDEAIGDVVHIVDDLADEPAALDPEEVQLLVAALRAGADLRAAELLPLLPGLCRDAVPTPIRVAALRALGDLGARDARICDTLLTHLDAPAPVGTTAFASLRRRTGERLPHRPMLWKDWRLRTALPEMTPEEHAARLAAERASRHRQRVLAVAGRD